MEILAGGYCSDHLRVVNILETGDGFQVQPSGWFKKVKLEHNTHIMCFVLVLHSFKIIYKIAKYNKAFFCFKFV